VPGTRTMQIDKTRGKFGFLEQHFHRSAGREGAHHVSCLHEFSQSMYDGRGNGNAEERRRDERAMIDCLLLLFSSFLCRCDCSYFPTFLLIFRP
jgi:hypothetical protein